MVSKGSKASDSSLSSNERLGCCYKIKDIFAILRRETHIRSRTSLVYIFIAKESNSSCFCTTAVCRFFHAPFICMQQLRKPVASAVWLWSGRAGWLWHRLHHQRFVFSIFVEYRIYRDEALAFVVCWWRWRCWRWRWRWRYSPLCSALVRSLLLRLFGHSPAAAATLFDRLFFAWEITENQLKLVVTSKNRQTDRFVGKIREFFDTVFNTYSPLQVRGCVVPPVCLYVCVES